MSRKIKTTPGFWLYLSTILLVWAVTALMLWFPFLGLNPAMLDDPEDPLGVLSALGLGLLVIAGYPVVVACQLWKECRMVSRWPIGGLRAVDNRVDNLWDEDQGKNLPVNVVVVSVDGKFTQEWPYGSFERFPRGFSCPVLYSAEEKKFLFPGSLLIMPEEWTSDDRLLSFGDRPTMAVFADALVGKGKRGKR